MLGDDEGVAVTDDPKNWVPVPKGTKVTVSQVYKFKDGGGEDFLRRAVEFSNEKLWGTLSAALTVHPSFRRDPAGEATFQSALAELRHGAIGVNFMAASFYGGTSLLIAVSVAFDLVQKIDSHLVMRNYRGLLERS